MEICVYNLQSRLFRCQVFVEIDAKENIQMPKIQTKHKIVLERANAYALSVGLISMYFERNTKIDKVQRIKMRSMYSSICYIILLTLNISIDQVSERLLLELVLLNKIETNKHAMLLLLLVFVFFLWIDMSTPTISGVHGVFAVQRIFPYCWWGMFDSLSNLIRFRAACLSLFLCLVMCQQSLSLQMISNHAYCPPTCFTAISRAFDTCALLVAHRKSTTPKHPYLKIHFWFKLYSNAMKLFLLRCNNDENFTSGAKWYGEIYTFGCEHLIDFIDLIFSKRIKIPMQQKDSAVLLKYGTRWDNRPIVIWLRYVDYYKIELQWRRETIEKPFSQ